MKWLETSGVWNVLLPKDVLARLDESFVSLFFHLWNDRI
jgi:hypothetical protein